MDNIGQLRFWQDIAVLIGVVAAILGGVGVIQRKFISPWIAKPLITSIKQEIREVVQEELQSIKKGSGEMEEEIASINNNIAKLVRSVSNLKARMTKIERQLEESTVSLDDAPASTRKPRSRS